MTLFSSSRPPWLRRLALANAALLSWSLALALPAQALAHQPPKIQTGIRHLTPTDMQKIVGAVTGVAPSPGSA